MNKSILLKILTLGGALLCLVEFISCDKVEFTTESTLDQKSQHKIDVNYGSIPMHFEPNHGQVSNEVKFISRGSGYALYLTSNDAVLKLHKPEEREDKIDSKNAQSETGYSLNNSLPPTRSPQLTTLRMKLLGANPKPKVEGVNDLPGRSNYFKGSDPKKWKTDVVNYAKVRYKQVYPGIDLIYYGKQTRLE